MFAVPCADENELIEYADGLLAAPAAARVADHLISCADCRAVLNGLALGTAETALSTRPLSGKVKAESAPAALLRDYLAAELPRRESMVLDRKSTRLNSSHRCISYAV